MNAQQIIDLLEGEDEDRRPVKKMITTEASIESIISAMREAQTPLTRAVLCDIVGARRAKEATPELLAFLNDPSSKVRSAAADALAATRDPKAGPALLEHFRAESSPGARVMLAVALGAVGHQSAVPDLINALDDPHRALRIEAAWALGELHATEAREQITRMLSQQTTDWSRKLLEEALAKLRA